MPFCNKSIPPTSVALATMLLTGCAIVGSAPGVHGGEGVAYMLPRALLPVELVYADEGFDLRIGDPVLVGDVAHTYLLQRSGNIFTSDNVTISVNPATGLLSAVDVKSKDEFVPTIAKLAGALKAESADAGKPDVIFRELFDPGASSDETIKFNERLNAAAKDHLAREASNNKCATGAAAEGCARLIALQGSLAATALKVAVANAQGKPFDPADCKAGFCYRINVPHVVSLTGAGVANAAVFGLPNRSPTFVMPLERWAFVKTTHDVKLEAGVFKSVTTDRPSSALAAAAAPLEVAESVADTVSKVIQLKIDLSGKEKALAEARVKELEAQAALDKALLDKSQGGKAEAALLGAAPGERTAPLSLRIGKPRFRDATTLTTPGQNPAEAGRGAGGQAGGQTSTGSAGSADKGDKR